MHCSMMRLPPPLDDIQYDIATQYYHSPKRAVSHMTKECQSLFFLHTPHCHCQRKFCASAYGCLLKLLCQDLSILRQRHFLLRRQRPVVLQSSRLLRQQLQPAGALSALPGQHACAAMQWLGLQTSRMQPLPPCAALHGRLHNFHMLWVISNRVSLLAHQTQHDKHEPESPEGVPASPHVLLATVC